MSTRPCMSQQRSQKTSHASLCSTQTHGEWGSGPGSHGGRSSPHSEAAACMPAWRRQVVCSLLGGTTSLLNVWMLGSISREFETKPGSVEGDTVSLTFEPLLSFPFLSLSPFLLPFPPPIPKCPTDWRAGTNISYKLCSDSCWDGIVPVILSHIPNVSFRSFKGEKSYLSEATKTLFSSPPHFVKLQSCFSSTQRFSGLWMCPDVHGMNKAINLYSSHFFWQRE